MRARPLITASLMIVTALTVGPGSARTVTTGIIEPELLQARDAVNVLVRFRERVPALPDGVDVLYRFTSIPAVYATVDPAALSALAGLDGLVRAEADKPIAFDLDSATVASRANSVWSTGPGSDPIVVDGTVIDGSGVGIAIVDTGLDGLHPDFMTPGKVGGNYLVTPAGVHGAPYTVGGSPHGTHVAGIAAGNGGASGGRYRGAAPGASVYGFGVAAGGTIAFPAIAFDWILQNGHEQDPPISIVNNSWHCSADATCARLNEDSIHVHLASRMAQEGIVVTWSAGNDGGDGFLPQTNIESINPTPGIISVANYDDDDRGLRTRCVQASSSRGSAVQPETWPDVAAPGRFVVSTWAMGPTTPVQDTQYSRTPDGRNAYRQASGTSMAAPHVAGIAALMLQAEPNLRPAEVEYLLKATASKLGCTIKGTVPDPSSQDPARRDPLPYVKADTQHPYDGANFFDGHGLADARAAVEAALAFGGIPEAPEPEPLPEVYRTIRTSVEAERTLFLRDPDTLSEDPPTRDVTARVLLGDEPISFTSEPLAPYNTDAIELELWFGTDAETPATYLGRPTTVHNTVAGFSITVDRLSADGTEQLVSKDSLLRLAHPVLPVYRRWVLPLDREHRFSEGDRLRVTLLLRSDLPEADEAKLAWILYADASSTPSSIAMGRQVVPVLPGTSRECKIRFDCAEIGGMRRLTNFECNIEHTLPDHPRVRVIWAGPPGSTAGVRCGSYITTCTIPGEATDPWGTCAAETPVLSVLDSYDTSCFYLTRDGRPSAGIGRCEQTPMSLEPQN